jgi:predicted transcriptional regulator
MHPSDPVNRIMTEPVLTIGLNDSVEEMLRLFVGYPVHHLPVVNEGCVVGMVSSADVLKLEFFLPPPGATREKLLNDRFRVGKLMRAPAITVAEHETVQKAAEIMSQHGIHSLPVVNGVGHLIGIVTTTDMMHGCLLSTQSDDSATGSLGRAQATGVRHSEELARAREAVKSNADQHSAGAALLVSQRRISALEAVMHEAKRYLNAGQDERLHASLIKAIERADNVLEIDGHASVIGLSGAE